MKYTSEQINAMTRWEWCENMAEELNNAGFREKRFREYDKYGKPQYDYLPYEMLDEKTFILGAVCGTEEIEHLKSIGLLNNGRCPMCGEPIRGKPGRFTDGYNPSMHFQICQKCVAKGNRSSNSGKGCALFILIAIIVLIYILIS